MAKVRKKYSNFYLLIMSLFAVSKVGKINVEENISESILHLYRELFKNCYYILLSVNVFGCMLECTCEIGQRMTCGNVFLLSFCRSRGLNSVQKALASASCLLSLSHRYGFLRRFFCLFVLKNSL